MLLITLIYKNLLLKCLFNWLKGRLYEGQIKKAELKDLLRKLNVKKVLYKAECTTYDGKAKCLKKLIIIINRVVTNNFTVEFWLDNTTL